MLRPAPSHKSGFVALAGKPNVGKSTLLNTLIGTKLSIVSLKPQTTRNKILGILNGKSHQIVFLDTPGLLAPKYKLQKRMVKAACEALQIDSDLTCLIVEPADVREGVSRLRRFNRPSPPAEGVSRHGSPPLADQVSAPGQRPGTIEAPEARDESQTPTPVYAPLQKLSKSILLVINKIDTVEDRQIIENKAQSFRHNLDTEISIDDVIAISALTGEGTEILVQKILERLPVHPPFFPHDQITDRWERFFAGECIRETIFEMYGEEIPYSSAVEITDFAERPPRKDLIRATIYVESDSQKAIILGAKGRRIRALGEKSRLKIEKMTGRPAYLELWIKAKAKWRNDSGMLNRLGYR